MLSVSSHNPIKSQCSYQVETIRFICTICYVLKIIYFQAHYQELLLKEEINIKIKVEGVAPDKRALIRPILTSLDASVVLFS